MIIDSHAHMVAFPEPKSPYYDAPWISAEQYVQVMEAKGIDKAVILPLSYAEFSAYAQNYGEVLHICRQYPERFIPFCSIDPRLPLRPDRVSVDDFLFHLQNFRDLGAKGVGELIARMPWNEPRMLKMLRACEILQLPLTFHTTSPDWNSYGVIDYIGLELLEGVLTQFPTLTFIGHSQGFWSEIGGGLRPDEKNGYPSGPVADGGAVPRLMREHPNLHADISAGSGLNALSRDPEFGFAFIDEFQDRLLLGLDYCSPTNEMQHIEWLTEARDQQNISDTAYEKIVWRNADRVLHLGIG